jgi:hypothetical protein
MRIAFLLLAIAGGCWPSGDGPWDGVETDPCSPGNTRTGQACSVPRAAVAVDGSIADWQGVAEVLVAPKCLAPPCEGLAPAALQLATTSDGWLAIHVRTLGSGPAQDLSVQLFLELTTTDEFPTPEIDRLAATTAGVHFTKNDYLVDPPAGTTPPYSFAWTADGFESGVNTAFLPFPAGARVATYAWRGDELVSSATPVARACWLTDLITVGIGHDTDFVADPCRRRTP